jgi:hypothetical protein
MTPAAFCSYVAQQIAVLNLNTATVPWMQLQHTLKVQQKVCNLAFPTVWHTWQGLVSKLLVKNE